MYDYLQKEYDDFFEEAKIKTQGGEIIKLPKTPVTQTMIEDLISHHMHVVYVLTPRQTLKTQTAVNYIINRAIHDNDFSFLHISQYTSNVGGFLFNINENLSGIIKNEIKREAIYKMIKTSIGAGLRLNILDEIDSINPDDLPKYLVIDDYEFIKNISKVYHMLDVYKKLYTERQKDSQIIITTTINDDFDTKYIPEWADVIHMSPEQAGLSKDRIDEMVRAFNNNEDAIRREIYVKRKDEA